MTSIQQFISACQWDRTAFLIVSRNVFDPFVYYSHLVPLLLSLLIGTFVVYKARVQLASIVLFALTMLFSLWTLFDLIIWATGKPHFTLFFWSLEVLIEPLIYAGMLYFVYIFIHSTDSPLKHKLIVGLLLLPTILLTPTRLALLGYDLTNCHRDALEGPLAQYGYAIEVVLVLWMAVGALRAFRNAADRSKKTQIILVITGAVLFLLTFSWGNIVGSFSDDWRLPQWGLFGMPVFAAFLSYLIVRFRALNIKLVGAQSLVVTLAALVGSQFFFIRLPGSQILSTITLTIAISAGAFLVHSVKREFEQRVQLEELAKRQEGLLHLISHDVKGALGINHNLLNELLEGEFGPLSSEMRDLIRGVDSSTTRTIDMTTTVLRAADAKTARFQYDMKPFNFATAVLDAIAYVKPEATTKGLSLEAVISENANWMIVGDRAQILEHVLRNLLTNAVIYTPHGGVFVSLVKRNSGITFKVRDTGIGLSSDDRAHLFTEGGKGRGSGQINIHSTGYGLYLAKAVVDAHHGRIWAESEGRGKGSTFYLDLAVNHGSSILPPSPPFEHN